VRDRGRREVRRRDHLVDHPLEAEAPPVLRREDPRDAVTLQFFDLAGDDRAAAAAEHLHVAGVLGSEEVLHVLEELDVAALVGRDRDALRVLLDRGVHDLLGRPVVAEVDDLDAGRLQQPPDHVDRGVVAVEQRRRRDEADVVPRLPEGRLHGMAESEPRGEATPVRPGRRSLRSHAPPARRPVSLRSTRFALRWIIHEDQAEQEVRGRKHR
jgi:hypothetical protein